MVELRFLFLAFFLSTTFHSCVGEGEELSDSSDPMQIELDSLCNSLRQNELGDIFLGKSDDTLAFSFAEVTVRYKTEFDTLIYCSASIEFEKDSLQAVVFESLKSCWSIPDQVNSSSTFLFITFSSSFSIRNE